MAHDDEIPPLVDPSNRYRMRRLTQFEMESLCRLARQGRTGPGLALRALWDLILRDAEGLSYDEAAERPGSYRVQNYSMAADQAQALHDAMLLRRRLHRKDLNAIAMMWLDQSPCDYEPDDNG